MNDDARRLERIREDMRIMGPPVEHDPRGNYADQWELLRLLDGVTAERDALKERVRELEREAGESERSGRTVRPSGRNQPVDRILDGSPRDDLSPADPPAPDDAALEKALVMVAPWRMRDGTECFCPVGRNEDEPTGEMPVEHATMCAQARAALAHYRARQSPAFPDAAPEKMVVDRYQNDAEFHLCTDWIRFRADDDMIRLALYLRGTDTAAVNRDGAQEGR